MTWIFLILTALAENPPAVGPHHQILVLEKNENPQNILVLYTKLDSQCHFVPDAKDATRPVFDFYWLMDRKRYKPVHPAIAQGVRDRVKLVTPSGPPSQMKSFSLDLGDLKELKTNLKDVRVNVVPSSTPKGCRIKTQLPLGPKETLDLQSIYSDAERTWVPPFRRLLSVKLKGFIDQTGKLKEMTFNAR